MGSYIDRVGFFDRNGLDSSSEANVRCNRQEYGNMKVIRQCMRMRMVQEFSFANGIFLEKQSLIIFNLWFK